MKEDKELIEGAIVAIALADEITVKLKQFVDALTASYPLIPPHTSLEGLKNAFEGVMLLTRDYSDRLGIPTKNRVQFQSYVCAMILISIMEGLKRSSEKVLGEMTPPNPATDGN